MKTVSSGKLFPMLIFSLLLFTVSQLSFSQSVKSVPLMPLTIYRPVNTENINDIRCWIKIEDQEGNDVTYSCGKASYAWIDEPNVKHEYERTWYLSGGMAMHLNLKKGTYKISFYTPEEKLSGLLDEGLSEIKNAGWYSNVFTYNTENPCNVIFVSPEANDNGFYKGAWYIDYRAPSFYKWTKPHIKY